jgi:hydrogenase maturation protease HycI
MKQTAETKQALTNWFFGAEKVVIVGVGNPFRKDDFVGVEIVRKLDDKVSKSVYLIEAETIPESYMQKIIDFKPTHILLIDAGIIKKKPGTSIFVDPTQLIRKTSVSTHTLPLRIFCDYLTKTTKAKIALLIIQPQNTMFGEGVSPTLQQTTKRLTNLLRSLLP